QAVRHLDPELRIGLRVEHDHLELLAVDAARLVDLGDRPFGGFHLILAVQRLRARERHRKTEFQHVLGSGRKRQGHGQAKRQAGACGQLHTQATIERTHRNLPLPSGLSVHAAARSTALSAFSASSVLITSAYFSDMSNKLTACETWLRS